MLGTIVNTAAILAGSTIGSVLKKGIKKEHQDAMYTAMGLSAVGIGMNAVVSNMSDSRYPVLFIVSLAMGSLLGTVLDLDGRFQRMVNRHSDGNLGQGLATAILMFCIGTLSILGPVQSALEGDNTYLFTNATLDFVTSMVLSSTYGIGIGLAALVLFLWQGTIYLFASSLSGLFQNGLMTEFSIVGGFLIAASGMGILKIKDCKTLNMLPSLLVPPVFFLICSLL